MTEYFSYITAMDNRQFLIVFAFGLFSGVRKRFFNECRFRMATTKPCPNLLNKKVLSKEEAEGVISTSTQKTFYPFNLNFWLGFPSQAWQWWFPYFRPYYPSKPLTWWGNKPGVDCDYKPQTQNIFGINDPPNENVEYLPPADEIDWGFDDFVHESL